MSMITMLQGMTHYVRTAFGDSTGGKGRNNWPHPVAGIGQGNGTGLQIWATVCTPLFDLMQLDGFVANICSTVSGQSLQLAGFAFVDDMDLCIARSSLSGAEMVTLMQHLVTQWEGLLAATGGALVPEKCFWYLLEFE